jgi:3-oxoacyl-[acyl-carrier protein] reductase
MLDLNGRVALVTGGSRGIGAAVALRLAQDGADVALTYLNAREPAEQVVKEIVATGRRGLAIRADSADVDAVVAAVDETVARLGGLDILVNNAGIFAVGPIESIPQADIDRTLAIHVRAPIVAAQAASRHMHDDGRIINIGSCLAERVAEPGMSLYATSKAALVGLTKGLARDLGGRGITANVVHPGPIDTAMNPADGETAPAQRELVAIGRFGRPDEVAATVAHLAGPHGRYISGAAIAVDGGFAA